MITYKIHLIRTGRTSDHPRRRYVGRQDLPLSKTGREALVEMAEDFQYPRVDRVYTSPLQRCRQSAEILYPDSQIVEFAPFVDMNMGEFEGKSIDELRSTPEFSDWLADSFTNTPPGGEETTAFTQRLVLGLDSLFHTMMEERLTNVAVITHGGVIMTLLAAAALPKLPLHQWAVDNGTGYTLIMTPQMWMRDRAGEVYGFVPDPPRREDSELYGAY